jgi:hypothetical protein
MIRRFSKTASQFKQSKMAQDAVVYTDRSVKVLGQGHGREWQVDAYDSLLGEKQSDLIAPCGSGKSTVQAALAIGDFIKSQRKQLIIVPQVHIADGFFPKHSEWVTLSIHGITYKARVPVEYNFAQAASVQRLINWLLKPRAHKGKEISGPIALSSYVAFVLAWAQMSNAQRLQITKTVHVRPDESHHVSMGDQHVFENTRNKVGDALRFMAEHGGYRTSSTATGFRGDGKKILPRALKGITKTYSHQFIKHFNTLGIEEFLFEINEFKKNPIRRLIKVIKAERNEKHFIVVPAYNAGWRRSFTDKSYGINALMKELLKMYPKDRILNLVPQEEGRKAKKQSLLDEPKFLEEKASQFDVVITVQLGREGTDWCPCSRLHVTYVEGSIVLAVQTVGRLLRYFKNKTKIVARYYHAAFPRLKTGASKFDVLDGRKNAVLLMMQADEMFFPLIFPVVVPVADKKSKPKEHPTAKTTLGEVLGDESYLQMRADFLNDDRVYGGGSVEDVQDAISELIQEYDVPEDYAAKATLHFQALFLRHANIRYEGIDIAFVAAHGFPKLHATLSHGDRTLLFSHERVNREMLQRIIASKFEEMCREYKARFGKKPSASVKEARTAAA